MTAAAYVERASRWARELEEEEAERAGLARSEDARSIVARRTGVPTGTLRSLRKNRLKAVAAHVYDSLNQAATKRLIRKLHHLEHELHLTRQQGLDPRSGDVAAVVADLAAVRSQLGLTDAPDGGAS